MPRVTEEYRAARRAEIVAAAGKLFSSNGFHSTSMADIISASGLSAGAVYRYFRSKEELIGAVSETALSTADEVFTELLADGATPSPAEAVTKVINAILARATRDGQIGVDLTPVALQVWAEAVRSPELSVRANTAFTLLRDHFAEVARRWQKAGNLPADADPDLVGAAMLGLGQGFLIQSLLIPGTSAENYTVGVQALLGGKG